MATATTFNREESQRRVKSPLEQLRGYIRRYVIAEGTAILLLYVAVWFWIGMLLDYGVFKLFAVDWVQILPRGFRAGVLCVLLAGLLAVVAVTILLRLTWEFTAPALALVLERRFPRVLGDRLITAVELADPEKAHTYGYSQAMVDQTIQDAAQLVERVPVGEVFDWKRLKRLAKRVAVSSVGVWVGIGVLYVTFESLKPASWAAKSGRDGLGDYVGRFGEVAGIWFERNILLSDTIWPRRAYLELQDFSGEEKRVGRDAPPPTLRVRAFKWMIADSDRKKAPEGWRPLLWSDLNKVLDNTVPEVPDNLQPKNWRGSVDEMELHLARPEVRQQVAAHDLDNVLEQLVESARLGRMSRKLRKLHIPDDVQVLYKGASSSNEQTLKKQGDNEYSGTLAELRESIRFTCRGEDYYTPAKRIVVVPPPEITELSRDEFQPAYLFYRIPKGTEVAALRGKRQKVSDLPVSLTGDTSRFEVPAGTDVILSARIDKELQPGGVRLRPRLPTAVLNAKVEQVDQHLFRVHLPKVTAQFDAIFEFTDTDNVNGARHVVVNPAEDQPPDVEVQVEVARRGSQGYLVTPVAMVPMSGKVRDDRGLSRVAYHYTLARIDAPAVTTAQALTLAGLIPLAYGEIDQRLTMLALWSSLSRGGGEPEKTAEQVPLGTFDKHYKEREAFEIPLNRILDNLPKQPPARADVERILIKEFVLDPETEYFDVEKLKLKSTDDKTVQARYRVRLTVAAADNNIETGPHQGLSKETFTLLVVSENELLTDIAKEEESLHIKLEDAHNRLKDARLRLEKVILEIPDVKSDEFVPLARRTEEVDETVVKTGDISREVLSDYKRILAQLRVNRVQKAIIDRVNDRICEPLEAIVRDNFPQVDMSLREAKSVLDAKKRDPQTAKLALDHLQQLLDRFGNVLDAMADITNINNLIAKLFELEQSESAELEKLKKLKTEMEKALLEGLLK